MVRRAHHDRGKTVRPERFLRLRSGHSEKPFALSREPVERSKGRRFAQHRLVEGYPFRLSVTFSVLRISRSRQTLNETGFVTVTLTQASGVFS
jgi:hypothetical protein